MTTFDENGGLIAVRREQPDDIAAIRRVNEQAFETSAKADLVREGIEQVRKNGWQAIVVVGPPGFYPRFGFVPASQYHLNCEYHVRDEIFVAPELQDGTLKEPRGLVKYQPEFGEV